MYRKVVWELNHGILECYVTLMSGNETQWIELKLPLHFQLDDVLVHHRVLHEYGKIKKSEFAGGVVDDGLLCSHLLGCHHLLQFPLCGVNVQVHLVWWREERE